MSLLLLLTSLEIMMSQLLKGFLLIAFITTAISACSPSLPEIDGFDSEAWKQDELGCSGERAEMVEALLNSKDVIVELREADIRIMFGSPDHVELFSRSQKFYLYYVETGGQCPEEGGQEKGQMLELSLDALGRAHELNIRQ